ncbi:MAG: hypothetical protein GXN93_02735, partial [Candidatus Diapherotrites archaeon]|nr:hypothetical protein [Candidatus Diapherotrites archaeon]
MGFLVLISLQGKAWHLEVGSFRSNDTIHDDPVFEFFAFHQEFDEVPLVFTLIGDKGYNPADLRIKQIETTGITATVVEPPAEDGPHLSEPVYYIAINEGIFYLPDGTPIYAGAVSTKEVQCDLSPESGSETNYAVFDDNQDCNHGWVTISFPENLFDTPPVILVTVQTMVNEPKEEDAKINNTPCINADEKEPPACSSQPWFTAVASDVSEYGFKLALERSETYSELTPEELEEETVAFLALPASVVSSFFFELQSGVQNALYETQKVENILGWGDNQNSGGTKFDFAHDYDNSPLVLAGKNSRNEDDGGWLRLASLTEDNAGLVVDEDKDIDRERNHAGETAGVVVFSRSFHAEFAELAGAVYNDPIAAADPDNFEPLSGVLVYAFYDDGDGEPDADDFLAAKGKTNSDGTYRLSVPVCPEGDGCTYWVVVDSKSINPSSGYNDGYDLSDVWAEQTYGPAGALCADPEGFLGGTDGLYRRREAGPCYSGRRGDASDGVPAELALGDAFPEGAEHVAGVNVQQDDVSNLDFAFSFNVVTNVNDQDDDAEGRYCQGCLRQFVINANAIVGENAMRFVPAVPANQTDDTNRWWQVVVEDLATETEELVVKDPNTTISGRAYSYANGTDERKENSALVRTPEGVGVSSPMVLEFQGPQLELYVRPVSSPGIAIDSSDVTVERLAIYGMRMAAAIDIVGSLDGVLVQENFLGARANAANPGADKAAAIGLSVEDSASVHLLHNYIANTIKSGVYYTGDGEIVNNFIENIGIGDPCADGISLHGFASPLVQANYIYRTAAYGIDTVDVNQTNTPYRLLENTITLTGQGDQDDDDGDGEAERTFCPSRDTSPDLNQDELGGIRAGGEEGQIVRNKIYATPGHGVVVFGKKIKISQNEIFGNAGISIDLFKKTLDQSNGDGVTPNDGAIDSDWGNQKQDYPVLTSARISRNGSALELVLDGYIGTPTSTTYDDQSFTLEVFKADDDKNNNGDIIEGDGAEAPHGEGRWYLGKCDVVLAEHGAFSCTVPVALPEGETLSPGDFVTATVTDAEGNTSEFGPNRVVHELSPYTQIVVINEVYFQEIGRGATADTNDEFIELFNAGTEPISLDDWRIGDSDLVAGEFEGFSAALSGTLQPGQYAVVWIGSEAEGHTAPNAAIQIYVYKKASLNNSGDDIYLFDNQNRLVDYMAYGTGSAIDSPPVFGIWDPVNQSSLDDVDEGQSISLTPNGVDSNTSACWEKTTSGDAQNYCGNVPVTVDTDDYDGRITSVGNHNNGFDITGRVYEDLEPSGAWDAGESWENGVTVYIKLIQDGVLKHVVEVAPGLGEFRIASVPPGEYELLLDDNEDEADLEPTAPDGWLFTSPEDGKRGVVIESGAVSGQDFGLFHGFKVSGRVFLDTGEGGGTANDALQNGEERGVANVLVTASDGDESRGVRADAEGRYTLYVPYNWGEVVVYHDRRPASGYNLDGSVETAYRVESYEEAKAADSPAARIELGVAADLAGQELLNHNFGVVFASEFRADQSGSA